MQLQHESPTHIILLSFNFSACRCSSMRVVVSGVVAGDVTKTTIPRDNSGNSRGYGFVHMTNLKSANQAIEYLNGYQIGNKRLRVQLKSESQHNKK